MPWIRSRSIFSHTQCHVLHSPKTGNRSAQSVITLKVHPSCNVGELTKFISELKTICGEQLAWGVLKQVVTRRAYNAVLTDHVHSRSGCNAVFESATRSSEEYQEQQKPDNERRMVSKRTEEFNSKRRSLEVARSRNNTRTAPSSSVSARPRPQPRPAMFAIIELSLLPFILTLCLFEQEN